MASSSPPTHNNTSSDNSANTFQMPLVLPSSSSTSTLVIQSHPFFRPNSTLFPIPPTPIDVLHNFRKFITTTSHKFLHFLHLSAAHNPFLNKIISFSSHIHTFNQAKNRNIRNVSFLANHNFAAVLPGDSVAGVVVANGVLNFLNLYNTLLVVRLVLTWFPNTPPQIVSPLSTLCDPYLNIFRGIIPPLGGTLDLSPILAFLVLNAFTSAATALPAELPTPGVSHQTSSSLPSLSDLTTSQKKWRRRLQGNKASTSDGPI